MPRACSASAMPRRLVAPSARIASTMGARSRAKASALSETVRRSAAPPSGERRRAAAPLGLPSLTPRALAAASASFVRREIARRSCSATSAMIPTVRSLASGMSAANDLCDWLDGAIALKYGDQAQDARRSEGKDTGTIRLQDDPVTVVAELPKRVDWDQAMLVGLVERIRADGADPADYVDIAL